MSLSPKLKNFAASIAAVVLMTTCLKAQQIAPFKAGDRVVFTGNSITDGGHYHSYIWLYYLTRYPNMPIRIFNAGIGGDVAKQIDKRLEDDVFVHNPTVITLTFGMNDTGYQYYATGKADSAYNQKIAISKPLFEDMEKKLLAYKKARIIMIGSSPYDETSKIGIRPFIGKNAAMLKIAALQKDAAKQHGWGFVDFNAPVLNVNLAQEKLDSTYTLQGADRIHPTVDGHMVMAYAFLKAQGLAGKKVAGISLNVKNHKSQLDNCSITNVKISPNHIQFTYLANALPYPIDTIPQSIGKVSRSQADALKLVPFTDEFNQETLQLSGLDKSKTYELTIDSTKIGKWTGTELDKGVNLALYCSTPQYQQALAVMHLNEERWATERRLREYWWIHYSILKPHGLLHNDSESTVDSLINYAKKDFFVAVTLPNYRKSRLKPVRDAWQKEIDLLTDELYRINKPKPHQFIIRPVSS